MDSKADGRLANRQRLLEVLRQILACAKRNSTILPWYEGIEMLASELELLRKELNLWHSPILSLTRRGRDSLLYFSPPKIPYESQQRLLPGEREDELREAVIANIEAWIEAIESEAIPPLSLQAALDTGYKWGDGESERLKGQIERSQQHRLQDGTIFTPRGTPSPADGSGQSPSEPQQPALFAKLNGTEEAGIAEAENRRSDFELRNEQPSPKEELLSTETIELGSRELEATIRAMYELKAFDLQYKQTKAAIVKRAELATGILSETHSIRLRSLRSMGLVESTGRNGTNSGYWLTKLGIEWCKRRFES